MTTTSAPHKKLTLCISATASQSKALLHTLESFKNDARLPECEVVVAYSCPDEEARLHISSAYDSGLIGTSIETHSTLSISRLRLVALSNVTTPNVIFLDVTTLPKRGWLSALFTFIEANSNFEIAAPLYPLSLTTYESDEYRLARFKRPWSKGVLTFSPNDKVPSSSFLLAKTDVLREIQFPDYGMKGMFDDVLLSDIISCKQKKLYSLNESLGTFIALPIPDPQWSDIGEIAKPETGIFDQTLPFIGPLFTTVITTHGDYPTLIQECLASVSDDLSQTHTTNIVVGCSDSPASVLQVLNHWYSVKKITTLIRSRYNINKTGIHRYALRIAETPYLFCVDDDCKLRPGWIASLNQFIITNHSFVLGGFLFQFADRNRADHQGNVYSQIVSKKRWWINHIPKDGKLVFAQGSCYVVRTAMLRYFDFPECNMPHIFEDVLLGDLIIQTGGKMVNFSPEIQSKITKDRLSSRGIRTRPCPSSQSTSP